MKEIAAAELVHGNTESINFNSLLTTRRDEYDMVVFSHLRWEYLYQRPQHIISRLAKRLKILFIEEPVPFAPGEQNTASLKMITDKLHLLQPRAASIADIRAILPEFVSSHNLQVGWFYSPAFIPLLDYFSFDTIVYDCIDELSLFKGAARELRNQEQYLISNASLVFAGGKSLFEAKSKLHRNVHCVPSSVDQAHFAGASNLAIPADIACIRSPIAGYFGVIDERMDMPLLNETALQNPDVAFVMIGPLERIDESDLARQPNIHYLGIKPYAVLPNYLKAFSMAIMPFAINAATQFISPVKTLEYMAAGKPVISTPVRDVSRDYSHCIRIVETPEEFTRAIRFVLRRKSHAWMLTAYGNILAHTSWDSTVSRMDALLSHCVQKC